MSMKSNKGTWFALALIVALLLGSCSALAGGVQHWPASLAAVGAMVVGKVVNDRYGLVKWPMEFLLLSAILLIVANLVQLYFAPA
jgi:hypothetical protein